jgi:hypothetical protein
MNTCHPRSSCHAISVAAIAVVLAGCAAPAPKIWRVAPNYRISNAGASADLGYMALARQYEGERRWREARDAWRKAALEAPEDAEILNALGMAEAGQGLYGNAVAALRRAVALAPQRVPLLNNLGYALLLDGQNVEAKSVLHEALARNPDHRLARANLSRVERVAVNAAPLVTASKDAAGQSDSAPSITATPGSNAVGSLLPPGKPSTQAPHLQAVPNLEPLQLRQAGLAEAAGPGATLAAAVVASPTGRATEAPLPAVRIPSITVRAAVSTSPRVEIANGNGVTGMAAWLNGWMRARGLAQNARLSNALPFNTATTVVHYRAGYFDVAHELAGHMPHHFEVAPEPGGALNADVRIVLGRDLRAAAPCHRNCPTYGATTPTSAEASLWPRSMVAGR